LLGKLLEVDYVARAHSILHYYVELQEEEPRVSKLKLPGLGLDLGEVLIDYEGEPIRCLHCLAFSYPIGKCNLTHTTHSPNPTCTEGHSSQYYRQPPPREGRRNSFRGKKEVHWFPRSSLDSTGLSTDANGFTVVDRRRKRQQRPCSRY
jgi:hypothetical protein